MISLHTRTPAETRAVGAALAGVLRPGDVVLLGGELGAGKTTFVQGVGERFGVGEPMTSPTFTLVRTYDTSPLLAHVDIWRVEHLHEVLDLGLEEILDQGGIALVEWGDVILPHLGREAILVHLARPVAGADEDEREITIGIAGGGGGGGGGAEAEAGAGAGADGASSSIAERVERLGSSLRVAG